MALRYRSVLSTTDPDVAVRVREWFVDRFGAPFEVSEDTVDGMLGFSTTRDRQSEIRVLVIPGGSGSTVVLEERHPVALGDVDTGVVPGYIRSFLHNADFRLGGLRVRDIASDEDMSAWVDGDENGQIVAVVGDANSANVAVALREVQRQVLGMAAVGLLPVAVAERLLWETDSPGKARAGAILHIARQDGSRGFHLTPATLVIRQPEAAARRQRRWWCLPWQAKVDLGEEVEARVAQLWERGVPVAGTEEEWLTTLEQTEQSNAHLRETLHQAWEEQDDAVRELQRVRGQLAYAQRRLQELESAPIFEQPHEVDDIEPETCVEVVEYGREYLTRLLFICDNRRVEELDQHLRSGVWAAKMWSALRAMDSYAEFRIDREYAGDFLRFCDDPPLGAIGFMANRVAMKESESTDNNRIARKARTFRVPEGVSGDRSAYMPAHIKIDKGGHPAPRIHFLDDTASSGKVIVGYIGRHLPTGG